MSEEIKNKPKISLVQPLLIAMMTLIVLALTCKTFYDVMSTLRKVSADNFSYREAFRLQESWRMMVRQIGPVTSCTDSLIQGKNGRLLLGREHLKCEIGDKDITIAFPEEFSLCPEWDKNNRLLVLQVSVGRTAAPPLRLIAVINGGEDHEKQ